MAQPFNATVAPEIDALGIPVVFFVMRNLSNRLADPEFDRLKRAATSALLARLSPEELAADPVLAGYHRLHERIACPRNRTTIPAPENLLKFLAKKGELPRVNLLVDIYNLISAETRLAMGAHDLERIAGNVRFRLTDGSELFHPLGDGPRAARAGEYAYIDEADEVLCRLEVRQVEKTKVTEETRHCFFIIQGNETTGSAMLQAATGRLIRRIQEFCGGGIEMLHCPWPDPQHPAELAISR
ncbi:DNA/RNA-binding domain of Phe-tRNA-synthetase-like protein [Hydrogenispora ethanolica]|uniref:DNA/RNA-binding domain of Phe-tRNA-synthetase-like protein n=1 Tax=Hydrogenispora ethanolica TaxID=1082276 RepID=A0A4R1RHC5_HYDET|nr:phenylalanine--tRNA ligase beta subunit-related protein [Hydrogenispora ethanolica]TCL65336.1 DNA/RNA-binding domain of Phe-tRNA-synthetase-like protein [Hydrogenispora ethanolica]